jgi:hypothetical protein
VSSKKLPLLVGEVHDANCLVGAQLHTDAHHQYMDDMVNNYLRSARQRFDEQQGNCITPTTSTTTTTTTTTTINRREARFSRSFSASSLLLTCMNGECQQPATHQTNFLCTDCFRYQKELMTSFSTTQPSHQHSRSDATAVKSQTMPAMLHTFSGGGGADRRSSFAMIDDEPPQLPSIHQHPLVAVRQRKSSECSSEVTRQYGVTAVPGKSCKLLYGNYANFQVHMALRITIYRARRNTVAVRIVPTIPMVTQHCATIVYHHQHRIIDR